MSTKLAIFGWLFLALAVLGGAATVMLGPPVADAIAGPSESSDNGK